MALTEHDQDKDLQRLYKEAETDFHAGRYQEALTKVQHIRNAAKAGILHLSSTQMMADILAAQGHLQEAFDLLDPIVNKLSPDSLIALQRIAYRLGKNDKAAEIGKRAYQLQPNYESAYINALCSALRGDSRPAIGWLQCAIREGMPNPSEALKRHEFDILKEEKAFQELLKKNGS